MANQQPKLLGSEELLMQSLAQPVGSSLIQTPATDEHACTYFGE
jgi:hypothetical protein